jgi:protein-disulfide isomerase
MAEIQSTVLVVLAVGGLLFSILSILEKHVKWIISFCAKFGEGCRRTLRFNLFEIPISWYGTVYYVALIFLMYNYDPWVFWLVMAGFGIELTFIWIMVYLRALCIFCVLNAIMMAGLFFFAFDPDMIWESMSIVLLFFIVSFYFIYSENVAEFKSDSEKDDDSIAAKINGDVITLEEVEYPLVQSIYNLRTEIYQLKKERLDQLIREILIKKQAQAGGKTEKELMDLILKKMPHGVNDNLEQNEKEEKIIKYADSLKSKYNVEVILQPPRLPIINIPVKYDPGIGPQDALVVVVEFSDYMCPACRKAHKIAIRIKKKYKDRIKWVFKDFPLEQHVGAKKMAEAAHCANDQGKFWQYQDLLFSLKNGFGSKEVKIYARQLGLDEEEFEECISNRHYRSKVEENVKIGREIGVSATPTFIINGKLVSGAISYEKFEALIEEALKKVSSIKSVNR